MGCTWSGSAEPAGARGAGGPVRRVVVSGGGPGLVPGLNGNPQNRRVKPVPSWTWDNGHITQKELTNRRQTFWEAQTSGRRIVWENLKVSEGWHGDTAARFQENADCGRALVRHVCAVVNGSSSAPLTFRPSLTSLPTPPHTHPFPSPVSPAQVVAEAMLAGNIELANTLLEAADIRVPHGDLSVCYDSLGQLYQIPRFVYSTPTNTITEEEAAALAANSRRAHTGPVTDLDVTVRISPSPSNQEQDVKMSLKSSQTVAEVKGSIHALLASGAVDQAHEPTNTKPNKWTGKGLAPSRQRLMYRGRELPEHFHMQEAGVSAGSIVQIFVRADPQQK
jgi:hypothetical protein